MPTIPNAQCGQTRCKAAALKGKGFCKDHQPIPKYTEARSHSDVYYNSGAWSVIRKGQLSIMPLCQACLNDGRVIQADHVDHLFAWAHVGPAAFKRNIFQSLCAECHGVKSSFERKGIYRHYTGNGILEYKITDYQGLMNAHTTPPPDQNTARARYLESADFRDQYSK
jgi:hypothetical protein